MKIFLVGGARPNFIKIAPITRACIKFDMEYKLIHTGQHYDFNMSELFFEQLKIKSPDYNLNVASSTHADQTAKIMQRFEKICLMDTPNVVIVVGDVNSTLACSIVVSKIENIKLAHVEAGLRCFDRRKPEEINRVVTDVLSDYLFVTNDGAVKNLTKEGIEREKIFLVGDTVIDSLIHSLPKIKTSVGDDYVLVTIHRPLSTDKKDRLETILKALVKISKDINIVFPIHPRTLNKIEQFNLQSYIKKLNIIEPVGYLDFLSLLVNSKAVVSDSGGLQIETSFLGIPCISIMNSTANLYTLNQGTNVLVSYDVEDIYTQLMRVIGTNCVLYRDKLTDGKSAERILKILMEKEYV